MEDYEKVEALFDYLLEGYDRKDPDYIAAEPFLDNIRELFAESYSNSDFCAWLVDHNMDILAEFRYADIVSQDDYDNPDDWEKIKENALLVSNDGTSAVKSWFQFSNGEHSILLKKGELK